MKIGLALICTRKYHRYLAPLLDDVAQNFLTDHDVTVYLFTDHERMDLEEHVNLRQIIIPPYGFPEASLLRFRMFEAARLCFDSEYIYFSDVDMRIVDRVGDEIIPESGMVGVHHARCWSAEGTWETRRESGAYVPENLRKIYYAGGFFGGERTAFFAMAKRLERTIDRDISTDTVGIWHDESYMNQYFAFNEPLVLPPTYCFPPDPAPELAGFEPKIVCVIKDHMEVRS